MAVPAKPTRPPVPPTAGPHLEHTRKVGETLDLLHGVAVEHDEALAVATVQTDAAAKQLAVEDVIKHGKGGTVGTAGRGVVSFRIDHQLDPFLANIWPLMKARNIPASVGLVTSAVGNPSHSYEPTTTTWANLRAESVHGLEFWAHSRNHRDPVDVGNTFHQEIVGARDDIEANGLRCQGWQQPGAPATYGAGFTSPSAMDTPAGRIIRNTFGLYEAEFSNTSRRSIPTDGCRGLDHVTIDASSLAFCQATVDFAAAWKTGVQFMLHPALIGQAGYMTLADFTALLDYVVARRDAGLLEPMTASGLAFADPGSSHRRDLVPFGTFQGLTTATRPANLWFENTAGSWTIQHDGGVVGNDYLRVPADKTRVTTPFQVTSLRASGHTYVFEAWTRSLAVGTTQWRVILQDLNDNSRLYHDLWAETSTSWTKIRKTFTVPAATTVFRAELGRRLGGAVDFDDVHIYAV
jgi:hypothetical protein